MHLRGCWGWFVCAALTGGCGAPAEPAGADASGGEDAAGGANAGGLGPGGGAIAPPSGGAPSGDGGGGVDAPPAPKPTRIVLLVPGTTIDGSYFDEMAARLEADGYVPVVFEPPDLFTESLAVGAGRIADEIDAVLAASGESKVHIVAECNGGVATRYFLQVLGGADRVDQVVTFVSAHHGTWLSPVGGVATGFQSLEDITPGSAFLAALDASPFPAGLRMTSIYSCNDELMLPYDTSVVEGATNVLFCDYYLGHFDGFWDPVVYERIRSALSGQGDGAPTYY